VALLGGLAAGACTTVSPREERDIAREEAERGAGAGIIGGFLHDQHKKGNID
jgi:hypothetical protein